MRNFVYLLLSTILTLGCVITGMAQRRVDTTELRERAAQQRRLIEDPSNNPFKIEKSESLKPQPQPNASSAVRAMVELQVVGIADGDTLIISNTARQQLLVRLQGIDAPETGQSFSREALESLTNLVSGKSVMLEFDPHGKPDSEGRVVAKVYLEGRDIALEQVKAGFAWFCKDYKKMQSESDRYSYAEAEKEARHASRGLWRESAPVAPWKYRRQ
ncbi:MAG: thermonuclease family protein [Acidobacteria bacterium]|nr:thermonuclease family protein [Acidobacteriota bacterium]